jgi:hypothetical protein
MQTISLLISEGCHFACQNHRGWTPLDYSFSDSIAAHLEECARITFEDKKTAKSKAARLVRTSAKDFVQ